MTTLKELQQSISNFVTCQADASDLICKPSNMEASERLQVYRTAYYLRLIECLEDDFPRLSKQLGRRDFGELVRDYLDCFPSRHFSIRDVGCHLVHYLRRHTDYRLEIIELAEFEWAMVETLFVKDETVLTLDDLNALSTDNWVGYRFVLIQAHAFVFMQRALALCVEEQVAGAADILIWRKQQAVFYQVLSPLESQLLHHFASGLDFATTCEKMADNSDENEIVTHISQAIQYWVQQGIFKHTNI